MRRHYEATATPWEWGWEIDIHGEGATQTFGSWRHAQAEFMVRDWVCCMHDVEPGSFDVEVTFVGDPPAWPVRAGRAVAAAFLQATDWAARKARLGVQ